MCSSSLLKSFLQETIYIRLAREEYESLNCTSIMLLMQGQKEKKRVESLPLQLGKKEKPKVGTKWKCTKTIMENMETQGCSFLQS